MGRWAGSASTVRRGQGGMAAGPLRGLAVAGGASSESEDDGWEIGYLDRTAQVARRPCLGRTWIGLPWPMKPLPCLSFPKIFPSVNTGFWTNRSFLISYCVFHQIRLFRLSIWLFWVWTPHYPFPLKILFSYELDANFVFLPPQPLKWCT